jgi:predicted permease
MALWQEVRLALRGLARTPGFTAVAVSALALGIGANAAIFSLVDAVMLRPLPYPQAERLYLAHMTVRGGPDAGRRPARSPWSYPKWTTFQQLDTSFESLAGFTDDSFNLTGGGDPERVQGELVSPAYFEILGQKPVLGGLLPAVRGAGESADQSQHVALLGEGLWRRRYGASAKVLGQSIELNHQRLTVVGVLPAAFRGLSGRAEVWAPLVAAQWLWYPEILSEDGNHWFDGVGRIRAGATPAELASAMEIAGRRIAAGSPRAGADDDGTTWSAGATALAEARRDPILRRALLVLLAAVGAVLLIACANLANLLLVRAGGRRREIAVRRALGASRAQVVRQLLIESLSLAALGGIAGLLLAQLAVGGMRALDATALGAWGVTAAEGLDLAHAAIDWRVLAFGVALAAAVGVATGLVPAFASARSASAGLTGALKEGGAVIAGAAGHRRAWGRASLVVGELALALVLVACAGLLLRTFGKLARVELGFDPGHLLTAQFKPGPDDYTKVTGRQFHLELVERLRALPGVLSASVATCAPTSGGCNGTEVLRLDGRDVPPAEAVPVGVHMISAGHLANLRARLLAGREFAPADRDGASRVAVVSESAARRLWPGLALPAVLGHRLTPGQGGFQEGEQAEVVGVVADIPYDRLEDGGGVDVYLPEQQTYPNARLLLVRTAGDPVALTAALRATVQALNPTLPVYGVRTMDERLGQALSRARFAALLLAASAALALALAVLGVYGVLAFAVGQRRRELAVRMALGARAGEVAAMVVRQGLRLAALGTALGLAGALAASRLLAGLLYGVAPRDPLTFVATPLLLLAVAAAACAIPARRAMAIEPAAVLRED